MCSFPSGICTGIDSFFDAVGYLFDSFINIPPADGEFTHPHIEPVKIMRQHKKSDVELNHGAYNQTKTDPN